MVTPLGQEPVANGKPEIITDFLGAIYRGRVTVVTMFVIVFVTVAGLTFLMDPVYESTTAVLIDSKQSPSVLFQDLKSLTVGNTMQNELEILQSNALASDVATRLIDQAFLDEAGTIPIPIIQPAPDDTTGRLHASIPSIAARLYKAMTFEMMRESDVIKVTASSTNAREAALIANVYSEAYRDRNVFIARTKSRSFREFLEGQAQAKKEQLAQQEGIVREYMERRGVVSLDAETRATIDQLSELEAQRDAADIEIQALLRTLTSYQTQIADQEKTVAEVIGDASDPYIRLLQEQLAKLEVDRDLTISNIPPGSDAGVYDEALKRIEEQITSLKQKLRDRTEQFVKTLIPSATGETTDRDPTGYLKEIKQKFLETQLGIRTLQAKRDALDAAVIEYERKFERFPAKSIEYARLERERGSMEKLYLMLEEKFNEANITEQSEFGYVDIFDPAVVPQHPASPNIILNLILGAFFGCAFGVGFVFIKDMFNTQFYSPESLKKKGYLPLSTVRVMTRQELAPTGKKSAKVGQPAVDEHLLTMIHPMSPIAESYRHLRTNVQYLLRRFPTKIMLVTSPEPGEGKTTTISNLAVAIAQSGKKVLLVDADLREPAVYSMFGLNPKVGLTDVLVGRVSFDQAIQKTGVETLDVMTSGPLPENPGELLGSEDMRFLLEQLKEAYEYILFDCPPVLAVTDASILATQVDTTILVVAAGATYSSALERTRQSLEGVGASILGVVLNKLDLRKAYGFLQVRSGFGYYGYAHRYGHYKKNGKGPGLMKDRKTAKSE